MKKQMIQVGLLCLTLSFGTSGYSQLKKEKQAIQSFNRMAYVDAIDNFERIVEKGYINAKVLQNLADAYYFNGKLVEANKWYTMLFEGNYENKNLSKLPSEYYYRYAQTLKSVDNYKKFQEMMDQFGVLEQQDHRVNLYNKDRNYLAAIENKFDRYALTLLNINTPYSDYGGTLLGNAFVYTSSQATANQKENEWNSRTQESYTSLYRSTIDAEGFGTPTVFAPEINSKVNDANAVFTQDGNTMYFTRNHSTSKGKSKQNKANTSVLKIYKVIKQTDGKWGQVKELPINGNHFNTAHPALTPDDKWLYFSSDRKGTIGQSDLFRVALYENGGYGPIENLGKSINTEGRENFLFISSDFHLYFSSDGHPGLGGLDVFMSQIYPDGSFGSVVNLGEPINSALDDFGFYFDPKQGKGFVSSNRAGGKGADDVYFLAEKPCLQNVEGNVYDKDTNEKLTHAMVTIFDARYQKSDTLRTNSEGYYITSGLDCDYKYRIKVEKPLYNTVEVAFNVQREPGGQTINIGLEKSEKPLQIHDNLFEKLNLQPIYFDYDQANIRWDAAMELIQLVEVMKQNPSMKIDVRSHTDSRGNDTYNLTLSDRRGKETIKWMIEQGIDPIRLTGRGYGETQVLNNCTNGVQCTEAEHQLNRRSDFIIREL